MKKLILLTLTLTYSSCSSVPKRNPSVFEMIFPVDFMNKADFKNSYDMFENLDKP